MSTGTGVDQAQGTLRDRSLEGAAESLYPDKSLDRILTSARFLLGGATIVTTLLASFGGLVTDATRERSLLSLPALACLAMAVGLAAWASVGHDAEVNLDNLEEVASFFARQIAGRARKVRFAGLAFALAIPLCALPAAAVTESFARPHLDASLSLHRLSIAADAGYHGDAARLKIEAVGQGQILASGIWEPTVNGRLSGYLTTPINAGTTPVFITATLTDPATGMARSSSVKLEP